VSLVYQQNWYQSQVDLVAGRLKIVRIECETREGVFIEVVQMATNAASSSQPLIPIFNGEKYEYWSIKMKTLFKSQDLWDLVENGYPEPDDEV